MPEALCASLREKIDEQIERTLHLIRLLPDGRIDTAALPGSWPAGLLLGHLLDCLAGFCAVLMAVRPERLAHFAELRSAPVNHACAPAEAAERIAAYRGRIVEGFALLYDVDLAPRIPTVFVRTGETVLTLLLGNLEHLINHKHQLFVYLKLMGVSVESRDLYCFRGRPAPDLSPEPRGF
jgi:hypothetical protein